MTENYSGDRKDELAAAYRDAFENAETLSEEWVEALSEAWDELDE